MDGQQTQQINLDLQAMLLRQSIANATVLPLILSQNSSVNLPNVTHYEVSEILDDAGKPTGEFVPVVFLNGGNSIELTAEENEIFRDSWKKYCNNANVLISMLDWLDSQLFAPAPNLESQGQQPS